MSISRGETREDLLNGKLSAILRDRRLHSLALQGHKTERGTTGVLDLVVDVGEHCVGIECEIEGKGDGGVSDADKRLPEGEPLEHSGKAILRVYSLEYPKELNTVPEHKAYKLLENTDRLFVKERTHGGEWQGGAFFDVDNFAQHIIDYWNRTDGGQELDDVIKQVAEAIDGAAANLRVNAKIGGEEKSDPEATAALVWLNALMFQELLHANLDPGSLPEPHTGKRIPRPQNSHGLAETIDQWREILEINWWPIFHTAKESLELLPPRAASLALNKLRKAASDVAAKGVIQQHDVAGRIYHKLLETRKFLATNYTSIPASVLLSGLVFDPDHPSFENFSSTDPETFLKDMTIVDPACGSGTLLMASLQRLLELYKQACISSGKTDQIDVLNLTMLEEKLFGYDVVPGAVHLAASTLSMSETSRLVGGMNLKVMEYGVNERGNPRLGSLDMLSSSPSRGNAEQLSILEEIAGLGIKGIGADEETSIKFPDSPKVIIANPPYTRAGGPGDESWVGWNPIFGSLQTSEEREKMDNALDMTLEKTCGGKLAGLGAAFFALADEKISIDGRIAFVLPKTSLTGSSWRRMREVLQSRYAIDWIITSHDWEQAGQKEGVQGRCWWAFSESTNLAEVLIIATRQKEGSVSVSHKIRFANLYRNPRTSAEAKILLDHLFHNKDEVTITIGNTFYGRIAHIRQSGLHENYFGRYVAYINSEILDRVEELGKGKFFGKDIPISEFGKIWNIGPADMSIKSMKITKNGKQKSVEEIAKLDHEDHQAPYWAHKGYIPQLGRPALWHHASDTMRQMAQVANATLETKKAKLHLDATGKMASLHADELWQQKSRLQVGTDLRLNTCSIAAAITNIDLLGVRMWVSARAANNQNGAEEITCLWLNSTLGLLLRIAKSNRPDPGRSSLKNTLLRTMPVLDYTKLTEEQLKDGITAYSKLKARKFQPIYKSDTDKTRQDIDKVIASILEIPYEEIRGIADILVSEPAVHGGKTGANKKIPRKKAAEVAK